MASGALAYNDVIQTPSCGSGTCEPSCLMFSLCHCGCGGKTANSPQDRTLKGYVRGRPYRYLDHHSPLQCAGFDGSKGVPIEDVLWMLNAMFTERMRVIDISRASGLSESHIHKILKRYENQRFVQRKTAAAITRAYKRLDRPLIDNMVPTVPLREFLARRGRMDVAFESRTWRRYLHRPAIGLGVADEMVVSLGLHPFEIWGEDFYAEAPPKSRAKRVSYRRDCASEHCFRRPGRDGYCSECREVA